MSKFVSVYKSDLLFLFLLYSFLPGIYKIMGNQLLLLLNIPIIVVLFVRCTAKLQLFVCDKFFLLYLLYIVLQTFVWSIMPFPNKTALLTGAYLSILPMTGFFFSRFISFFDFVRIVMIVSFFHGVVGVLQYPLFGFSIFPSSFSEILLDGVMAGRMSSVSGSLGFGCMLTTAAICAFYFKKRVLFSFFLVCIVFSLQRSAWLATVTAILLCIAYEMHKKGVHSIFKYFGITIFIVIVLIFFVGCFSSDLNLLIDKFNSIGSAIEERDGLWLAGIENFKSFPLGTGVGQVGQVARFESSSFLSVPDGDYFRILSEFGIVAVFFYLLIFISILFLVIRHSFLSREELCILSIVIGFSIQMIGSNITEFYYNNFIYWIFVGYFFLLIKKYVIVYR